MSKTLMKRFLARSVKKGTLLVGFADGDIVEYGVSTAGYPDVTIRFTDRRVPRDIVLDPRLGAAETYMDGRLVIENGGGIMELVQLLRANSPWEGKAAFGEPGLIRRLGNRLGFVLEQGNNALTSRRNVAHHYDIGNDLYRLMLDAEHMQYSCAYWPADDRSATLAQAQEAKLAHIAAKLRLPTPDGGEEPRHVLDIGCGWGGMAIYLATHFNVRVTGITLSAEQLELARTRAEEAGVADRVTFELVDYRDVAARGDQFDRIVSVGMFEHVGQRHFDTFFQACSRMLHDDGVMLIHTIGRFAGPGTTDAFTRKYIFPGGYIPALSETVASSEKYRLIASDVEMLRVHYARTLREWYRRCMDHRDAIVAMYDERFFRMWTFYLAGATSTFEYGGMGNYQIQFMRSRHAAPITRDYMHEGEARLLAD